MTTNARITAGIQALFVGSQASALDPKILIKVGKHCVVIGFVRSRCHADELSNELTRIDIELRYILGGIADNEAIITRKIIVDNW